MKVAGPEEPGPAQQSPGGGLQGAGPHPHRPAPKACLLPIAAGRCSCIERSAEENPWEFTSSGWAEGESSDEFLRELIFPSFF